MECLKEDKMLKFRPDTLQVVRKELNLDKPGRIAEAVDILEKWVQMQPHFVKKDFCKFIFLYLCLLSGLFLSKQFIFKRARQFFSIGTYELKSQV